MTTAATDLGPMLSDAPTPEQTTGEREPSPARVRLRQRYVAEARCAESRVLEEGAFDVTAKSIHVTVLCNLASEPGGQSLAAPACRRQLLPKMRALCWAQRIRKRASASIDSQAM